MELVTGSVSSEKNKLSFILDIILLISRSQGQILNLKELIEQLFFVILCSLERDFMIICHINVVKCVYKKLNSDLIFKKR